MPKLSAESIAINDMRAVVDEMKGENFKLREHVSKCFDRIDDLRTKLGETKEKVYENTIVDLKNNAEIQGEIRSIAGTQGSRSGKIWGIIAGAAASAIIKAVLTIF